MSLEMFTNPGDVGEAADAIRERDRRFPWLPAGAKYSAMGVSGSSFSLSLRMVEATDVL